MSESKKLRKSNTGQFTEKARLKLWDTIRAEFLAAEDKVLVSYKDIASYVSKSPKCGKGVGCDVIRDLLIEPSPSDPPCKRKLSGAKILCACFDWPFTGSEEEWIPTTSTPQSNPAPNQSIRPQRRLHGDPKSIAPELFGRDELSIDLCNKLKNYQVLVLCGEGGIGKTSLAVKLMVDCKVDPSELTLPDDCKYDNALYCTATGIDYDLAGRFFEAFGLEAERDSANPTPRIETIVERLRQETWLVIIDNLESLMESDSHKAPKEVGDLLFALADKNHKSKIVITSQKSPHDLHARLTQSFLPRVCLQPIEGISDEASFQLLKNLKMEDTDEDLWWIAKRVNGNVFVLELLRSYSTKPGELRNRPDLVTHIARPVVEAHLERQDTAAKELLRRMCVLRIEMNAKDLTTLRLLQLGSEVMESIEEAPAATEDLLTGLVYCGLVKTTYDKSAIQSKYTLHGLSAETIQAIYKKDLKQLWLYAAGLYYFIWPAEFNSFEDLQFPLEEAHFHWESQSTESIKRLMSIVTGDILPKLREWCYWDLEELWLHRILKVYIQSGDLVRMAECGCFLAGIASKRGKYDEAIDLYNNSLLLYIPLGDPAMADCWSSLAGIAIQRGDYDEAKDLYNRSLTVVTELGDRARIAGFWGLLAGIASHRGEYEEAKDLYNRSLTVFTELGDREGMATCWGLLAGIASKRGEYDEAKDLYNRSIAILTELGQAGMTYSWGLLGNIAIQRGNYDEAKDLYNKLLAVQTELGDRVGMADCWSSLGNIASNRDDLDEAKDLYNKSLAVQTELGDRAGMAHSCGCLGMNELNRGDLHDAEIWFKQALTVFVELQVSAGVAQSNWALAWFYRVKGDEQKAQEHYEISHDLYTELGAKGDLEHIERGWLKI